MSNSISTSFEDHVAHITLKTPTMGPAFFDEIGERFRSLAQEPALRVVRLSSETKAFSYGLDLLQVMQSQGHLFGGGGLARQRQDLHQLIRRWQGAFEAVAQCPVPVIAEIHGWCIGGGLDLISACDLRLASGDARFSLRETKMAIVADLGSLQRLPGIIGAGHTRELAFTGGDIDARRALEIGLLNHLYDDKSALAKAGAALASQIAANPPLVVRGVKEIMDQAERPSIEAGLRYVAAWNAAFLASEDLAEAMTAFAEKRAPRFRGK